MLLDATAPHTRVDNFVIDEYMDKIEAIGLAIYTVIKRHYNWTTGQCTPSYERIAQICHIHRSTVIRYVKRLKEAGLISPHMRFTDEGQTSNQYEFYQPKRPKLAAVPSGQVNGHAANDTSVSPAQMDTPAQVSPPVALCDPPSRTERPDQEDLNKREKKEKAKVVPLRKVEEKKLPKTEEPVINPCPCEQTVTLPSGQIVCVRCLRTGFLPINKSGKKCVHPKEEIVRLSDGVRVCTDCYDILE